MKTTTFSFIIFLSLLIFNCKDISNSKIEETTPTTNEEELDPLDAIEAEQHKDLANAYFYVLAPNGLSLRKEDNLKSKKLLTIPFGAKVKQVAPNYTIDLTVENIDGSMMEVLYDGKTGYAFSGFLSQFPLLKKDEKDEDYVARLKAIDSKVEFQEKETNPDFHEGIVQILSLPSTEWHEAFYLAKANYGIPNSLTFPGHNGKAKEIISQSDKEDYVWSSDLSISRNSSSLDTIQYNWRAEGSGYFVEITKPKENFLKIEYTGFVD